MSAAVLRSAKMADQHVTLTASDLEAMPLFPLPNAVLLPGAIMPLHIFETRYRELTADVLAGKKLLAIARLRPGFEASYYERPPVYEMCGVGQIIRDEKLDNGRFDIVVEGVSRVKIVDELPALHAYRQVTAEVCRDARSEPAALAAWERQLATLWEQLASHLPAALRDLRELSGDEVTPGFRADRIASAIIADPDERQQFLEELDPGERFCRLVQRAHDLLLALSVQRASDMN